MVITSELSIYFLNRFDIIRIYTPSYNYNQPFWSDINKDFGVWHTPSSRFVHSSPCFSAQYQSNNHGMRDKERDKKSANKRFAVIGDSFVEGYGVNREERFTNLLEGDVGIEFLNFGTSGVFGLTQAALLYESLASEFDHTDVIISILPFNDFSDDDIIFGKTLYSKRYRPYLVGDYPDYEIEYFKEKISSGRNEGKIHRKIMSFFREYTFTYNFMVMIRDRFFSSTDKFGLAGLTNTYTTDGWSGYFDVDNIQLNKMLWSLTQISKKANISNRNLYLFVIPTRDDIRRLESSKVLSKLQSYLNKTLPLLNIKYIPMTEKFVERSKEMKNIETYYLSCDDHWNSKGNILAKDVIKNFLFQ